MKPLARFMSLLLCAALLLSLFACSAAPKEDAPPTEPVDHRQELDEDEPVTLKILSERTMWGNDAEIVRLEKKSYFNDFLRPIIDWYEKEHPNVKIEVENPSSSSGWPWPRGTCRISTCSPVFLSRNCTGALRWCSRTPPRL